MHMIEVQNLWKRFKSRQGTVEAVRGISLCNFFEMPSVYPSVNQSKGDT